MKPEPFGRRGRGRENGSRRPAGRPRITNSKAVAIGTAIAIIASLIRVGCMSGGHGVKRMTGAEGSATSPGGGQVHSRKRQARDAATAAGTMAGLFPGSGIGASLDQADRLYAARLRQAALESRPSGVPSRWHNPNTGNAGAITPTRTDRSAAGIYCREYQLNRDRRRAHRASPRQRLPPSRWLVAGIEPAPRPPMAACPALERRRSIQLSLRGPAVPAPSGSVTPARARA